MAVLILDLETVCEPWWSPPDDDPDRFPPAPAWRVIVAGMLSIGNGAPAWLTATGDERAILEAVREHVSHAPMIVTWHGRRFDVPVVMARSLALGIEQGWYYAGRSGAGQDPRYRYAGASARHLDLADQLADYGAGSSGKLDDVARAIGFGGKGDTSGADVADMFARGELDAIRHYCERDVLMTAAVWARWELLTGAADEARTEKRIAWLSGAWEALSGAPT